MTIPSAMLVRIVRRMRSAQICERTYCNETLIQGHRARGLIPGAIRMTGIVDVVVGSAGWLATEFASRTSAISRDAIRERQRVTLAISGGSVTERLVSALRTAEIDWGRADLFWCDERCVPPSDPESNFGAARSTNTSAFRFAT